MIAIRNKRTGLFLRLSETGLTLGWVGSVRKATQFADIDEAKTEVVWQLQNGEELRDDVEFVPSTNAQN